MERTAARRKGAAQRWRGHGNALQGARRCVSPPRCTAMPPPRRCTAMPPPRRHAARHATRSSPAQHAAHRTHYSPPRVAPLHPAARATHPATALPHHCRAPRRPTVARRTLRTATARHSHRHRAPHRPTPLAPRRTPPAPRYHRLPYRPRRATIARHHHTPRTPRATPPSRATPHTAHATRRPARIRAPTFSTARRSALPK